MNIRDFLSPNDVAIDIAVSDKQKLLFELASKAGARLRLPPDHILAELSKREELGSTFCDCGCVFADATLVEAHAPLAIERDTPANPKAGKALLRRLVFGERFDIQRLPRPEPASCIITCTCRRTTKR
jgi:hypothetical protein